MAIAGPITGQEYSSSTTASTSVITAAVTVPVGTLLLFWTVYNVTTAGASCTDNSVQAGAANVYTQLTSTTATGLAGTWIWCVTTRQIQSGNAWTVVTNSATRRNIYVTSWTGAHATAPVDFQTGRASITASPLRTPAAGNSAALAGAGELGLYGTAWLGGAVLSGVSNSGGNGWGLLGPPAGSGGVSSRVEAQVSVKPNATQAGEFSQHSWTSVTRASSALLFIKPAAGTAYTQSVSGALSFVGRAPIKATSHKIPVGALSFSGARTAVPKARLVAGALQPTGSTTSAATRARSLVAAAFAPTGSVSRAASYARSLVGAVFAPTGAQARLKSVSKILTGAVFQPTGARTALPAKALNAIFRPAGAATRIATRARALVGAIFAPTADEPAKQTSHRIPAGVFRPTATVATSYRGPMQAALSFVGSVAHGVQQRTLFAGFQPTATELTRNVFRLLLAGLQNSAILNTRYIPVDPGALPPSTGGGGDWVTFRDPFSSWPYIGSRRRR